MKNFFARLSESIEEKLQFFSIDSFDVSIEQAFYMVEFLQNILYDLRDFFINYSFESIHEEINFFKEMKPEILSHLLYFNKVYTIELKRPNGSDNIRKKYYEKELNSLTYFFNRNLDFYQYYRSHCTYFDKFYFVRGNTNLQLCVDSTQFVIDPLFSTGYDLKVAKILSNEMLRIFLNKKIQSIAIIRSRMCIA